MNSETAAAPALESGAALALGADELEFGQGGGSQRWPCRIALLTEPAPRLVFEVATRVPTIALDPTATVRLLRAACSCEVTVVSAGAGDETRIQLAPARVPISIGSSEALTELRLALLNFPDFFAGTRRNCLDVTAVGWNFRVQPAAGEETRAFRSPYYQVTHSARVRRADAGVFPSTEAGRLLDALHAALSFTAGRWSAPVLVGGWETGERCAWQEWGVRPVDPALARLETWFEPYHGEELAGLLPGVLRVWSDPASETIFRPALSWYLAALTPRSGPGESLLLLQAALDVLAWGAVVVTRQSLSAAGFRKLSASDRMRLLLEHCRIPPGVPAGLAALKAKAVERKWIDGPHALAAMRRRLLYPDASGEMPWREGSQLAAWYAELALLRAFEYSGTYSNRTRGYQRTGLVEPVPWKPPINSDQPRA